jgi:hypothetical protein
MADAEELGTEGLPSLGPGDSEGDDAAIDLAEQALVEVLSGCRTADAAAAELRGYLSWINAHPSAGKDLASRAPEFFAWLRKPD